MFRYNVEIFYAFSLFLVFCESSETSSCKSNADSTICSITDSECQGRFLQNLRDTVGRNGSPALNLPKFEPYELTNASFSVLGLDVTLVKGETIGITTTCDGIFYKLDLESYQQIFEIICTNITITGEYTITSDATADQFLGARVNGNGYVNMVAEDWYYKFVTPFDFVRYDDGQIYWNLMYDRSKYVSKILSNVDFCMDGITLNDKDISNFVSNFVTDNWALINTPAADQFHKKQSPTSLSAIQHFLEKYLQVTFFVTIYQNMYVNN